MVKSSFKSTVKIKIKNEIGVKGKVSKNHISSLSVPSQELLPISESDSSSAFSSIITLSTKVGHASPKSTSQNALSIFRVLRIALAHFCDVTLFNASFVRLSTSLILKVVFFLATSVFAKAQISSISFNSEYPTGNRTKTMAFPVDVLQEHIFCTNISLDFPSKIGFVSFGSKG